MDESSDDGYGGGLPFGCIALIVIAIVLVLVIGLMPDLLQPFFGL